MSYILDALRRADAERERGAVPGLNAQRFAAEDPADDEPRRRGRPRRWLAAGGLAVVLLGGALAWRWMAGPAAPASTPPRVAAVPEPVPASAAVAPLTPAPAPAPAPARTGEPLPSPAPERPVAAPALRSAVPAAGEDPSRRSAASTLPARPSRQATAPAATRREAGVAASPPPGAQPPRAQAPPAPRHGPPRGAATAGDASTAMAGRPGADGSAPAPRVYAPHELPEDIRRQLPQLSIGGSIYSQDRANRFLIINGQVFHEGAEPSPGLVLEQIGLKSAVLRFRDHRYSIGY